MTHLADVAVEARDEIAALPRAVAVVILEKVTELQADPYAQASTAVARDPASRRLRVGDHRVYYRVAAGRLTILSVRLAYESL